MSITVLLFSLLSVGAIISAITLITRRNPVSAAMSLIVHFFTLAGMYLTLQAQFIAIIQILVYAGAIMVLVVFVIMLLNIGKEENIHEKFNIRTTLSLGMAVLLVSQFLILFLGNPTGMNALHDNSLQIGSTQGIGTVLFTEYLFPFEAISLLLLAAIVGALYLAKRKSDT
ncbi:MAG: NADH-quinone oxidoreductase subunit J [Ignavibacteria bacterium]|nr:NADH-quinone oxidoreductase subunit J [Ignavibacteria bacterium]